MIKFNNVSFGYGKETTIDNLTFTIERGEFVAVTGHNGAGKSTVSKLINGLNKAQKGEVLLGGKNVKSLKSSEIARIAGFLFQNPDRQLCCNTVREEILFGLKCIGKKNAEEVADSVIERFGFDGESAPFSLSRGQRQRVALASILAAEPDVLILDEPTTGLDYKECMQIMHDIQILNTKGVTVVMVCHDMEIVLDFAKRVLVLENGRLIADGTPHDIFRNKDIMEKASLLPPQIIALSSRLGGAFSDIDNAEDMAFAVKKEAEI